jgi:metal-sulfur cluster biosynthetic enzyme
MPAPLTEADIHNALRDCYEPGLDCNIVDLGLVAGIGLAPDPDAPGSGIPGVPPRHRVTISLTLPWPESTEAAAQLTAQIQNRLAAFEAVSRTTVALLTDPPWTPNRISPEGRQRLSLNMARKASPLIQIKMS